MTKEKDVRYRHELKYLISAAQMQILKTRITGLIPKDPYVTASGGYTIRSLYFDDRQNRAYYENENGTDPREKFRIRIYNASTQKIKLECKRKERGKTLKTSCTLTEEQARMLMNGQCVPDIASQPPVLRKLTNEMRTRQMKPVVIVEYERVPYVYRLGNVRVTFDTNIASSGAVTGFLDGQIPKRQILPAGMHLLEVKFDEYLPDFIYRALMLDSLQQTAFSKYYLCRKYSL
ncbi:MAG: polyphosphate polymerase domain-containing protein [Oscillospiraceae bacterium]|nr:polyphosphate polymerase domain-containing protein [Oscillospiraceae bacterium]